MEGGKGDEREERKKVFHGISIYDELVISLNFIIPCYFFYAIYIYKSTGVN